MTSINDIKWDRYSHGMLQHNDNNIANMKGLLGETGCGFCLAKFRQVTMHLGTGMTHSCHHPAPHKIPLDELKDNPSALFNTKQLKKARTQMLNNERPSECDYCWRVEDDGGTSDRTYKSLEPWASTKHDEIASLTGNENIYPSYLEVSFSNVCNMKCTYCGPEYSSKWVEELKKDGPVPLLEETEHETHMHGQHNLDTLQYKNRESNPYIDAFWEWLPGAMPNLEHLRITGGEPLMSKETFKTIEWLIINPNTELDFSINTNMAVPEKLWNKFIDAISRLRDANAVRKITIFTSVEGWGERAEYARTGLDFELLKERVEQVAAMDNIRINIMSAFNIFSVTSFDTMLKWVHELKIKFNVNSNLTSFEDKTGFKADKNVDHIERRRRTPAHELKIGLDIPYLRHPEHLDVHFCTHQLLEDYLFPTMNYMASACVNTEWNNPSGFESIEFNKFKRIVMHRAFFNKKNDPDRDSDLDIVRNRARFYDFVTQMDKRRGTDFLTTFPEMQEFYEVCHAAKETLSQ